MPSTIGRAMRRLEDPRLITGQGRYAGDIQLPNLAHLVFVRSSQPHASIRSVDVEAARAMPGVIAVWTAADLPEPARAIPDWQPRGVTSPPRTVLAQGEVNYVGEAKQRIWLSIGTLILCTALDVSYDPAVLSWEPGPQDSDGVWAKHWYSSVWTSTGFAPYVANDEPLPVQRRCPVLVRHDRGAGHA